MNTDEFVRELARSQSHAVLSPSDLESMAKRASNMYLSQDTPLTDAVVKIAQECSGISPEQVKRVVEMTNTSTYQRLFEKGGEARNVQFTIADPSDVLRRMNSGASAPIIKVASTDYSTPPPRAARGLSIEADMALCDMFGVQPSATEAMSKTAFIDPARGQAALELLGEKEQTLKAQKKVIEMQMTPPEPITPPGMDMLNQNMRPPMGGMMGKTAAMVGSGMLEEALNLGRSTLKVVDPLADVALSARMAYRSHPHGMPKHPAGGSLVKEAMVYVKSDRPDADLVEKDLQAMFSLENIKQATAKKDYQDASPFEDLVRTRSQLEKSAGDVRDALGENEYKLKTARADLNHQVVQHVLDGGNLGEVVHLMSGLAEPDLVKSAMEHVAPELERRLPAWQFTALQSGLIAYEMQKSAAARIVNSEHPIAQAFAGVLKLEHAQDLLKQAQVGIAPLLKEANDLVAQASMTRV